MYMLNKLQRELNNYMQGETQRSFIRTENLINYENEYISVLRVDSSNKWIGQNKMTKSWAIIVDIKKPFTSLANFVQLSQVIDVKITPVKRGVLQGNYGIRFYGMKQNPDEKIITDILNFIFGI